MANEPIAGAPNITPSSVLSTGETRPSGGGGSAEAQPRAPDGKFTSIADYKYGAGDNVPAWAVGRSPAEVAAMADQLYQDKVRALAQPLPSAGQAGALHPPTADDYLTDPVSATNRAIQFVAQTQFAPELERRDLSLAQTSRMLAEFKYKDEFRRWGPEILQLEQNVAAQQRNPQTYDYIVDIVRGRHAREVSAEAVEQEIQRRMTAAGAIRPDGAAGAAGGAVADPSQIDLESKELPGWWTQWCRENRITASTIDEFLLKSNIYGSDLPKARTEYMKAAKRQDSNSPIMEYGVAGRTV